MDEVNLLLAQAGDELRQAIERCFLGAPIEGCRPVGEEVAQHVRVHAFAPAHARQGLRQAGVSQAIFQVIERAFGEGD